MRPLIVCATREEIKESIPFLEQNNIPYLITGVGMVATTFALTKYLSTNTIDYIINIGIAGTLDKNIVLGHVVEVYKDIFTELGAEDDVNFIKIEDLGFGNAEYNKVASNSLKTNLPQHVGMTVNTIHGTEASITRVKSLFPNATIESMEGAAIFYAAAQFNIPSIQVRAVSNYVEKRDKSTWKILLAIKNVNNWLQSYLHKSY